MVPPIGKSVMASPDIFGNKCTLKGKRDQLGSCARRKFGFPKIDTKAWPLRLPAIYSLRFDG